MPRPVVFLDCDGVLNGTTTVETDEPMSHYTFHRVSLACVRRLNYIALGCQIVISSTWRFLYPPKNFERLLQNVGLDPLIPVAGYTTLTDVCDSRDEEIRHWLQQNPDVTRCVILDDTISELQSLLSWTVHVDPATGLQDSDVLAARKRLQVPIPPDFRVAAP